MLILMVNLLGRRLGYLLLIQYCGTMCNANDKTYGGDFINFG